MPDAQERIPTTPPRWSASGRRVPNTLELPEFELRWCSFGFLLAKTHAQPQEPDP